MLLSFFTIFRSLLESAVLLWTLSGSHAAFDQSRKPFTVYVFLSTECPISQQYAYRLATLQRQYQPSAVRFVAVFPLKTDTERVIEQFRNAYGLSFRGTHDRNARLARQFGARVTPEVVVLDAGGRTRYRGAIDDWYVALGKHRADATQHYLRDALNTLLAGEDVTIPKTEAVGCLIE